MTLAVSSFLDMPRLESQDKLLNLAWTVDEQELLSANLRGFVRCLLEDELQRDLPYIHSYLVHDPWGEDILRGAVATFFSLDARQFRVTCGAGVMSLLCAFAHVSKVDRVYVIGDVFPDFPHWAALRGLVCTTRAVEGSWNSLEKHIAAAHETESAILLIDRPALIANDLSLQELRELCAGVGQFGACVLIDESYANYYPSSFSAVHLVSEFANLAVLRGLSKAYSLGGLRIGYCVASSDLTDHLRAALAPMLASSLSLWVASRVLQLGDITEPLRQRIVDMRVETTQVLKEAGLTVARQGSAYMPHLVCGDKFASQFLQSRGIIAKPQPLWAGEFRQVCRVSVPLAPARMESLRYRLGKQS